MDFAIGIVTYERPDSVAILLDNLFDQTYRPDEVFVVDDSPDDRTGAVIEAHADRFEEWGVELRYHHGATKSGQPAARNEIIERTGCDVVCFLDDDTVCKPGWLRAIVDAYEEYDATAVGGPAIRADEDLNPTEPLRYDDENLNEITAYGEVGSFAGEWVPSRPILVDALIGANMSFRTDALERIGGFDTGYGGTGFFEEWDVMAKLRRTDEVVVYHPEAFVYHLRDNEGGTRAAVEFSGDLIYWVVRNGVRFRWHNFHGVFWLSVLKLVCCHKHFPPSVWRWVADAAVSREPERLKALAGLVDGLLYECDWSPLSAFGR